MGTCGQKSKRKKLVLTETEKALLDCKTCRDKISQYIKRLEKRAKMTLLKTKELLLSKEKDRARTYLRINKLHREQIKVADGQLEMINEQILKIETTNNLQETLNCLEKGNKALKEIQKTIKIEEWEKMKEDLNDLKEKDKEIGDYLREIGVDENEYDDKVDQELNKMIQELQDSNDTLNLNLPNVPKNEIEKNKNEEKEKKKKIMINE